MEERRQWQPYLCCLLFTRITLLRSLSWMKLTQPSITVRATIYSAPVSQVCLILTLLFAFSAVNLRKVCNYISQRSKTDFQCIVISLKDMFFERSDSLVGVCRDVPTGSSRTLTLDLTEYDKKDEEKKGKKRKAKSEGEARGSKRRTRSAATPEDADDVESV